MPHLLEACIASILVTIAAAANVLRVLYSHVLLTRSLELESGSQHFAPQEAVAARVSGGDEIVNICRSIIVKLSFHRYCELTKLPWVLSNEHYEDQYHTSGAGIDLIITIYRV